jgi:protein FrlC
MKLAFNSWVYSSFPTWLPACPLDVMVPRIAAIGYDAIELGAASPHAYPDTTTSARRLAIRRLFEANGIALSSMLPAPGGGAGFNTASPIPEERALALDQYVKVIDLCAELGGTMVLYVAGWQVFGTSREEAWKWSCDALAATARHGQRRGITICVEPTPADSNLVDSAEDGLRIQAEAGEANVKLMVDTFHAAYRQEDAADYVRKWGRELVHTHLADTDRRVPGDGSIDFARLIAALKAHDYQGYLTVEAGFTSRQADPDDIARRSFAYLKPLI